MLGGCAQGQIATDGTASRAGQTSLDPSLKGGSRTSRPNFRYWVLGIRGQVVYQRELVLADVLRNNSRAGQTSLNPSLKGGSRTSRLFFIEVRKNLRLICG